MFALLDRTSSQPAVDRLALLRWSIFQILIGNTDAHGKNLSFFIDSGGIRLAPSYDLLCCLMYAEGQISDTLSMAIGDNFDARTLTPYDWALMGAECGLNARVVGRELKQLADKVLKIWPELKQNLVSAGANDTTLNSLEGVFNQQCTNALSIAGLVPKISKDIL